MATQVPSSVKYSMFAMNPGLRPLTALALRPKRSRSVQPYGNAGPDSMIFASDAGRSQPPPKSARPKLQRSAVLETREPEPVLVGQSRYGTKLTPRRPSGWVPEARLLITRLASPSWTVDRRLMGSKTFAFMKSPKRCPETTSMIRARTL